MHFFWRTIFLIKKPDFHPFQLLLKGHLIVIIPLIEFQDLLQFLKQSLETGQFFLLFLILNLIYEVQQQNSDQNAFLVIKHDFLEFLLFLQLILPYQKNY